MYLVAIERRSGTQHQVALQDGESFVIGRQPDTALAGKYAGNRELRPMQLGNVDRTISRTHAWGERDGKSLVVNRIPPDPGKKTPHPFVSIYDDRRQLPDRIVLDLGQSFGIHSEGWVEFHWVGDLSEVPGHALADAPSMELEPVQYKNAGFSTSELAQQLDLIQNELPRVFSDWSTPDELFGGAARFVSKALPAQRQVTATFVAVEPGVKSYKALGQSAGEHVDFRPSSRLLGELYSGASALRGTPRVVQSRRASGDLEAMVSITYSFDWILAVPVGAMRKENGAEHFQPCMHDGKPVCLYVETRESIDQEPRKLLPFLQLVNSLVTGTLQAHIERERRLSETGQQRDLLGAYRGAFLRALGESKGVKVGLPEEGSAARVACERAADALASQDIDSCLKSLSSLAESETAGLKSLAETFRENPPSPNWRDEFASKESN